MTTVLTIPKDYEYVLLAASGIALQCFITGFSMGRLRRRIFPEDFMKANFGEVHKAEYGKEINAMGLPDTGSGRYSEKLNYTDWYNFNCAQRAHGNFVEQIGIVIPLLLIAGVFFPALTGWIGLSYFLARIFYTFVYRIDGPEDTTYGCYIFIFSIISLAIMTFIGSLEMISN